MPKAENMKKNSVAVVMSDQSIINRNTGK